MDLACYLAVVLLDLAVTAVVLLDSCLPGAAAAGAGLSIDVYHIKCRHHRYREVRGGDFEKLFHGCNY